MKTTFRFPGSAEYAFAELETTPGSVPDNARELRDIDAAFLALVGNVLSEGCTLVALGPLRPQVIQETWNDAASMPEWASQPPQEAQGYTQTPQAYNTPQNAPQGGYGGYQNQAPQQNYQQQAQTPPGQQAPVCQHHRQAATFKPGGVSRTTNRPYDAFWACSANDRNCTKASNFPKP